MFLARQYKAPEPRFEVHDQAQVFGGEPLRIINVVQLSFVV